MTTKGKLITVAVLGAIGTGVFLFVYFKRKASDKKADEFTTKLNETLDPTSTLLDDKYNPNSIDKTAKLLNTDEAKTLAKNIWGAWGYINDDEELVYSQLKKLMNQQQLKQVNAQYQILSGGIAIEVDFQTRMSEDENEIVRQIINNLPKK